MKPNPLVAFGVALLVAGPVRGHAQAVDIPPAPDSVITTHTIVLELPVGGCYEINHQPVPREQLGAQIRAIYGPRPSKVLLVLWDQRRSTSDVMDVVQIARTEGVTVYRAPDGFGTPMEVLHPGQWTGSSIAPEGEELQLTFDVTLSTDGMHIVVNTADRGSYPFSDVKLVNDTLTFTFQPGPTVRCVLPLEADGSYSGVCTAGETGETATMRMIPPRRE